MYRLFHGKNGFLSLRAAKRRIKELQQECPECEYFQIDAEAITGEELVQTYQTTGMFSVGKIIFIKRLNKASEKEGILEDLFQFLAGENETTHIVIWEDQKIASNTKYFKFFKESSSVEEADELNKRTFISWAKQEMEEAGIEGEREAIYLLAEKCNFEAERFINELQKFNLTGAKSLDSTEVEKLSTDTYEHQIWDLIDSINRKNDMNPTQIVDKLLRQKVEPIFILSMIIRNSRLLILTKFLAENGADTREIASKLKIPPFTVPALVSHSRGISESKLRTVYNKIYNLDYEIKTGNIDPELGVTLLTTII